MTLACGLGEKEKKFALKFNGKTSWKTAIWKTNQMKG
jgi:hypothetical protein